MDQVYHHADTVSVWLGHPKSGLKSEEYNLLSSFLDLSASTRDALATSAKSLLQELGSHPYWERYWVIQECLLGKNLEICFGTQNVEPSTLCKLVHRFGRAPRPIFFPLLAWAGNADPKGSTEHKGESLAGLLYVYSDSKCEDSRDRVFALLGLIASEERGLLERFLPDYTMTADDVIVTVLAHMRTTKRSYQASVEEITPQDMLLGFGLEGERRQQVLERAKYYDYLGDVPSNLCPWWLEKQKRASGSPQI